VQRCPPRRPEQITTGVIAPRMPDTAAQALSQLRLSGAICAYFVDALLLAFIVSDDAAIRLTPLLRPLPSAHAYPLDVVRPATLMMPLPG